MHHPRNGQEDKMKTPWSDLLEYGAGIATVVVLGVAGLMLFVIIGVAVLAAKLMDFIK